MVRSILLNYTVIIRQCRSWSKILPIPTFVRFGSEFSRPEMPLTSTQQRANLAGAKPPLVPLQSPLRNLKTPLKHVPSLYYRQGTQRKYFTDAQRSHVQTR